MEKNLLVPLEKIRINKETPGSSATAGCCGGTPTQNADACCKLDEEKKAEGEEGCGCNSKKEPSQSACC